MTKKYFAISLLVCSLSVNSAIAGTYEWTTGFGMGVVEYNANDGNENSLTISCPHPDDGNMSASAKIKGNYFHSDSLSGQSFDVIVDGEVFSNPFYTDCRACHEIFIDFWDKFRNANRLEISAVGTQSSLPIKGLSEELHPLGSAQNPCFSAW